MTDRSSTQQERVKKAYPNAGIELSAMHGFRVVDYTDQYNPRALNRGCKTEAAAWRSVADRHGLRRKA